MAKIAKKSEKLTPFSEIYKSLKIPVNAEISASSLKCTV